MTRLALLLVLAAMMFGVAGLATATDEASAQQLPPAVKARVDLDCTQVVAPGEIEQYPTVGVVKCTVTVDIPDGWSPLLPDPLVLTVWAAYGDRDGNGRPSHGDRLLCGRVVGPAGGILWEGCRPGIEVPPDLSWLDP